MIKELETPLTRISLCASFKQHVDWLIISGTVMIGEAMYKYVYCVSCDKGSERKIIDQLFALLPPKTVVLFPVLERTEKHNKEWITKEICLTPGYLFIYSDSEAIRSIGSSKSIHRVLAYLEKVQSFSIKQYHLCGNDLEYAKWLFQNGGRITVSTAKMEGTSVVFTKGPLSAITDSIMKIDKHNRKALVHIRSLGGQQTLWLSFSWDNA